MKIGVFLARMQPIHNAHLYLIEKALKECEQVYVVLGSDNKENMLRNPYDIALREEMLRECIKENDHLFVFTLPDWSTEGDTGNAKMWGRYFYYNVVSRIRQKTFSIYYSDDPAILDSWFKGTEIADAITYRLFERSNMMDGLSATKIRQAFIDGNKEYIKKYCPEPVVKRFDMLAEKYKEVAGNPVKDYAMT